MAARSTPLVVDIFLNRTTLQHGNGLVECCQNTAISTILHIAPDVFQRRDALC
jgi:hypothetical protein